MRKIILFATAAMFITGSLWFKARVRSEEAPAVNSNKSAGVPAPEFTSVSAWINSKPVRLGDQKGKVVVVHFWTNGCINCIHNYPHYRAWQDKYREEKRFLMVGVHTPEFENEHDLEQIEAKAAANKLTFAIAVDNDNANWNAWKNRFWPCIYLVDKSGAVRQRWDGELGDKGYENMTAAIDDLLKE